MVIVFGGFTTIVAYFRVAKKFKFTEKAFLGYLGANHLKTNRESKHVCAAIKIFRDFCVLIVFDAFTTIVAHFRIAI